MPRLLKSLFDRVADLEAGAVLIERISQVVDGFEGSNLSGDWTAGADTLCDD